jgi:hypothetical protein
MEHVLPPLPYPIDALAPNYSKRPWSTTTASTTRPTSTT